MADAKKTGGAAPAKDAKAPKDKAPKAIRTGAFNPAHRIVMGTDKEGKPYGPKNNPRRAGTKSADRFAIIKDGMTVESFVKAGGLISSLQKDVKRGNVKVVA
mgnify:CR=1 FL=1